MNCLSERRLLELHTGDGSDSDRRHATECADCGTRLRALARDVGRIDAVLHETPPRRAAAPRLAWRIVPLALATLLALTVMRTRVEQAPVASSTDDTLALADEVADVFADDVASAEEPATGSTCTWGDPLLGVGCDEPGAMQIAWR
jgi:hypothetical protein